MGIVDTALAVMGRKKRSLPDDEYELTGQLRHIFRKPQPNKELSKPVNFIVKCGNFKWHVHEEPIVQQSGFFKMMSDSKFRVRLVPLFTNSWS